LQRIDDFLSKSVVLPIELETARIYGGLKRQAHAKGRSIPENDLWIAAIAVQADIPLLTADRHFEVIDKLSIELFT
jgi:tRNA(fMet)-specific endonuclease VapC